MRPWMESVEKLVQAYKILSRAIEFGNPQIKEQFEIDRQILSKATPFQWSYDTMRACIEAGRKIPADTDLNKWNVGLASHMWWWFDTPLQIQTVTDPLKPVRALAFGWFWETANQVTLPKGSPIGLLEQIIKGQAIVTAPRLSISCWIDDKEDVITASQIWYWKNGESIAQMLERVKRDHQKLYGSGGKWEHEPQIGLEQFLFVAEIFGRFILAGVSWLEQKVLLPHDEVVERHRRKDYVRTHKLQIPHVRVIQLRRAERKPKEVSEEISKSKRSLSVRFVVDGHWRNQPFGPKHGDRRLTWISAYPKGPEDAPWVGDPDTPTPKVYVVNR